MNSNAFQALIDLVDFDQKTVSFQKNIKKIESEVSELKEKKDKLEAELQEVKDNLHDTQKEVDMGELEMKEYDEKIKLERARLDETTNQKEYSAVKKEIENLEKKQHDSEEPLLAAWNTLEQVRIECKKKEEAFDMKSSEISQLIEEKSKKIQELINSLDEHLKHREEKVEKVPEEWLEKYKILGSKVSDPVVTVENGSCSACFYDATSQSMIEMRKGKLVQCKGCYRFLYMKKEEEK
ncbi:zinc ribbon domain-containing protein [Candidatus Dependentiae bacterium]